MWAELYKTHLCESRKSQNLSNFQFQTLKLSKHFFYKYNFNYNNWICPTKDDI